MSWLPPSPFETAQGYVWLPRMLAKARRAREDALGVYLLFEASPLDAFALKGWRVTGAEVSAWLDEGRSDDAIAAAIAGRRGHDAAARARWSKRFVGLYGFFMASIDADEGRRPPGALSLVMRAQLELVFRVVQLRNRLLGLGRRT